MRKLVFGVFATAILFVSCGDSKKETLNKMANEYCEVMKKRDPSDPMNIFTVTSALAELKKKEEYAKISNKELYNAMAEVCPGGEELLKTISKYD